jgi:WD40 repeat protein
MGTFSPDGRWMAILRPFSGSLYIYSSPGLEQAAKLSHRANISEIKFSPRSDEVVVCSRASLDFWSTTSWQRTRSVTNLHAYGLFYGPDTHSLWLRRDQGSGLFDGRTLEPRLLLPDEMVPLSVSPDGRLLAVSVDSRQLQVWNLEELRAVFRELKTDWADDPRLPARP